MNSSLIAIDEKKVIINSRPKATVDLEFGAACRFDASFRLTDGARYLEVTARRRLPTGIDGGLFQ